MIAPPRPAHTEHGGREHKPLDPLIAVEKLDIYYGDFHAVRGVDMLIGRNEITALIGPSGCGKSTVIRCFDRMNDLIPSARVEGKVLFHGQDLYAKDVDPIEVRRRSAWFPETQPVSRVDLRQCRLRSQGRRGEVVQEGDGGAGRAGADRRGAMGRGQGQAGSEWVVVVRWPAAAACIARAIATKPEVILMDEPCSALDPIATAKIEDLMQDLVRDFDHHRHSHMQQAARVSDRTAFFTANVDGKGHRYGHGRVRPHQQDLHQRRPPHEDYISGRFG